MALSKPLILWVNDFLMAVFFLLVGLEIKREVLEGALSTPRKAALPLFAALGGIAFPALIYTLINLGEGGEVRGWPIPAATDIAFVLGILALFGKRVPVELKVFLTAVAVVDDLGAVLIIAAFLTDTVALTALLVAAGVMVLLTAVNRSGVRHPLPYVILGLVLWVAFLKSGVHATIAGVLLAVTIPARTLVPIGAFALYANDVLEKVDSESPDAIAPDTAVHRVRHLCDEVEAPMLRWEHGLQPYVLFAIVPVFALANAGVSIGGSGDGLGPIGWGVAAGLLFGKPIGITLGAWIGVKLRACELPAAISWRQVWAVSWFGGIGFTMSLFISNLALSDESAVPAKLGLLLGSVLAGIAGSVLLLRACPPVTTEGDPKEALHGSELTGAADQAR